MFVCLDWVSLKHNGDGQSCVRMEAKNKNKNTNNNCIDPKTEISSVVLQISIIVHVT